MCTQINPILPSEIENDFIKRKINTLTAHMTIYGTTTDILFTTVLQEFLKARYG